MPSPGAFDASTPADAQTNPWRVSAITSGGRERTTSPALAQDHLDLPRVAVRARELDARGRTARRRRAARRALDLRDGLLRDDDDVARLEPAQRARRPRASSAAEVVALRELGQPLERDHADRPRGTLSGRR